MDSHHIINQAINLLQGIVAPSTSAPIKDISIPEYDQLLQEFANKSTHLSPEIKRLSDIFVQASSLMKRILTLSNSCKKFTKDEEEKLKNKFISLSKETEDLEKKGIDYIDHCRAIRELLSTTFWVFVPTPQYIIKGAIESADFNALKFQKKKNQDHNDWYRQLGMAVRSLEKFVIQNYANGLNFNPNGTKNWDDLFSSNPSNTVEQKVVQSPSQSKEGPKGEVKKMKKKQLVGQNYNISNYENDKIELKANDIEMKHGIFLENCKNFTLKVDAKFKSIQINKCEALVLIIKNCVTGVEIMNSKNVEIYVKESTPSISVDKSQVVKVVLNEHNLNCDIVSSKASELNIAYEKDDGNESKSFMVCQQLITKWNPQKKAFETGIYDKFM